MLLLVFSGFLGRLGDPLWIDVFHMFVACIITEAYRAEYVTWITIKDPGRLPTPQGL